MGNISELPGDLDCISALLELRRWEAWWMLVGVSLGQYPPEPLIASRRCSDLILMMVEML